MIKLAEGNDVRIGDLDDDSWWEYNKSLKITLNRFSILWKFLKTI